MHILTRYIATGLTALTISSFRYSWIQREMDNHLSIQKARIEEELMQEEIRLKEVEEQAALQVKVVEEPVVQWQEWELTFYCSCSYCSGGWGGQTASGQPLVPYVTCAADSSIPFGTIISIEGFGDVTVVDRGGAVKNNVLDIYVSSHEEALSLGRQYKMGYIK